jgi:predicted TIM-barrel fold metal-dependent hydrolase
MTTTEPTARPHVAAIRDRLRHPVIDVDGHTVEVTPVLFDYVQEVGGTKALADFEAYLRGVARLDDDGPGRWTVQPGHWTYPASTLDRATASLPRLYHERMDEIGLDVSVVYPTIGIMFQTIADADLRPLACRAVNHYLADVHQGLTDRLLPVCVVPLHSPEEGIEELDHSVHDLGLRAAMIPSFVKRPVGAEGDGRYRVDSFGIDGEHDYDPFWARCVELGVVPGVHTPTWGMPMRESVSNFVFTHIGQFSTGAEVFCRSVFLGGVFHRFPELRVAALEGGMGWAASLYAGLLGHWEKRNGAAIHQYDPARLDGAELRGLVERYGDERTVAHLDDALQGMLRPRTFDQPPHLDDFDACPFASPEDLRDCFTDHIYVGCEADDPMNALAFDTGKNPLHARFRAVLGSDIGHWDVTDVGDVLAEAYELVEDGLITDADFEELTFTNPARLYASANPDFFAGTRVEAAVAAEMAEG